MNWVANNLELIADRALDHLAITLPAIIVSLVISIPLGWLVNRYAAFRGSTLTALGLLYAIPSLPLFIALPAIIGTSLRQPLNVTIALTLYGIALMVRSTADGLASVDSHVAESATAMGFSTWTRFWRVDLPLAGPVLLAGLRVVSVSTVSLATVGAVLGVPSLGSLFTDGLQRSIPGEIIAGIVATIAIALVLDAILVLLGRVLMPWRFAGRVARVQPVDRRLAVLS